MIGRERVLRSILKEFPRLGRARTPRELAQDLGISDPGEIAGLLDELERADAICREGTGRIIVAYPYSSVPTSHQVTLADGERVWAMCAIDALGIHFMVGQDITIDSSCPQARLPIRIRMEEGRIAAVEPGDIVVWRSKRRPGETQDAVTCCPSTNFFSSGEALNRWRRGRGGVAGQILSIPEAVEVGRAIFGRLLADSDEGRHHA